MPRWRRPSLQQARAADPLRANVETSHMSFEAAAAGVAGDHERRVIGYRLVRLLDSPDELRAKEIGVLDQGDEVQLVERRGVYWKVLCPDGRSGWIHRMTIAEPALATATGPLAAPPAESPSYRRPRPEPKPEPEQTLEQPYAETDAQPVAADYALPFAEEPSTDGLLEAYMKARGMVDMTAEPEPATEATQTDVVQIAAAPAEAEQAAEAAQAAAAAICHRARARPRALQDVHGGGARG